MKHIIILILLFFVPVEAQQNQRTISNRQSLNAETIRISGLTRFSDVFKLLIFQNNTTINGYNHSVIINALGNYESENLTIMFNGQKLNYNIFGDNNINNIPVSLGDIDSIEIYYSPGVIKGESFSSGLIHIHSIVPDEGINIKGKIQIGSETGDPGPYRYTGDSAFNIDNQGTNYSASLNLRKEELYAAYSFKKNTEALTSPAYLRRIGSIKSDLSDIPRLNLYAHSFMIGFSQESFNSDFFATTSEMSDYHFFNPFGREIPLRNKYVHAGLNGNFNLTNVLQLSYNLIYSKNEILKEKNELDLDFNWQHEKITANLESNFSLGQTKISLGGGINFNKNRSEYLANDDVDFLAGKLFGETTFNYSKNLEQNFGFHIDGNSDRIGYHTYAANRFAISKMNKLLFFISFSKNILGATENLWFWINEGYGILDVNEIEYNINGTLADEEKFAVDLLLNSKINSILSFSLSAKFRSMKNLIIEQQDFQFNNEDFSLSSPVTVQPNAGGNVLGAGFSITHNFFSNSTHTLSYNFSKPVGSSDIFNNAWKNIPVHLISYNIIYTPFQNFSIFGRFSYKSSTFWFNFRNIEQSSNGIYKPEIDGSVITELGFLKYFWERKLSINIILRDLLDSRIPLHPVGRESRFGFLFKAELDLQVTRKIF